MSDGGQPSVVADVRRSFAAGDYRRSRALALEELSRRPDDATLLRLAGKAGVELDVEQALDELRHATELAPDDPDAWRDLGDALVSQGALEEAREAFGAARDLRSDDTATLVDLAHVAYALGDTTDALRSLELAVEADPESRSALHSLAALYRAAQQPERALDAAVRLAELEPDDPVAALDVAELSLETGRLDDAVAAFHRLRAIDDEPDHAVYAYHGMIEAEMRRERWRRALDLAVDATRVDRLGRTTDVLAFAVAQVFGDEERPGPTRAQIDEAFEETRAEHRRLHAESLVV